MQDLIFWRDVSLIVLVAEAIIIAAPSLVIGYYVVKGLRALRAWLAEQFPQWQALLVQGRDLVAKYAAIVAAPVMAVAAVLAAIAAAARAVAPGRYDSAQGVYYERD